MWSIQTARMETTFAAQAEPAAGFCALQALTRNPPQHQNWAFWLPQVGYTHRPLLNILYRAFSPAAVFHRSPGQSMTHFSISVLLCPDCLHKLITIDCHRDTWRIPGKTCATPSSTLSYRLPPSCDLFLTNAELTRSEKLRNSCLIWRQYSTRFCLFLAQATYAALFFGFWEALQK